jgi:hypothetical protein
VIRIELFPTRKVSSFSELTSVASRLDSFAARYLAGIGELTDVPGRSPSRGPPYWKSVVLRKKAPRDAA